MIKAAIGNLQTALKTLEARKPQKKASAGTPILKLSAMMAKWVIVRPVWG